VAVIVGPAIGSIKDLDAGTLEKLAAAPASLEPIEAGPAPIDDTPGGVGEFEIGVPPVLSELGSTVR